MRRPRFFYRIGASQLDRTICASAGTAALNTVYGTRLAPEPQSIVHAKLIIAWGANIHGNNIHLWPFIDQARRNGARLVVIDHEVLEREHGGGHGGGRGGWREGTGMNMIRVREQGLDDCSR